jgi:hypothetical protein
MQRLAPVGKNAPLPLSPLTRAGLRSVQQVTSDDSVRYPHFG